MTAGLRLSTASSFIPFRNRETSLLGGLKALQETKTGLKPNVALNFRIQNVSSWRLSNLTNFYPNINLL